MHQHSLCPSVFMHIASSAWNYLLVADSYHLQGLPLWTKKALHAQPEQHSGDLHGGTYKLRD